VDEHLLYNITDNCSVAAGTPYALQSMRQLLETLLYGLKKLPPFLAVDFS